MTPGLGSARGRRLVGDPRDPREAALADLPHGADQGVVRSIPTAVVCGDLPAIVPGPALVDEPACLGPRPHQPERHEDADVIEHADRGPLLRERRRPRDDDVWDLVGESALTVN